jgi:hypothetical protein
VVKGYPPDYIMDHLEMAASTSVKRITMTQLYHILTTPAASGFTTAVYCAIRRVT